MSQINLETARYNMVEQQIRPWEVLDQRVLDLIARSPREDYVPAPYRNLAYADMNIPLGHGQVMMPPKLEARLLQALDIEPNDAVLEIGTGSGYMTSLLAACFSPDGNWLFTFVHRGGDRCGLVWDAESGEKLLTLAGDRELLTRTGGVDISRDGKLLAMTAGNGVRVYTNRGEAMMDLAGHSKPVTSVAFSPDARRLFSGSDDGTAKVWHVPTGTEILTLRGYEGGVHDVAWSPGGRKGSVGRGRSPTR